MDALQNKRVLIIAGGTGGHVMPALAVAQYLKEKGVEVHWLGTRAGFESGLVPQLNISISYIDSQALRRTTWTRWLFAPWRITRSVLQSFWILKRERPHVVLSMGGYVAGPGALAAWLMRRPLVLHEQNAISGWTNRLLAKFAKRIMVSFPHVFAEAGKKVIYTGNPIRKEILAVNPVEERFLRKKGKINLLVLGGSQGASILNQTVPEAIALIPEDKRPCVWHQAGKAQYDQTRANYAKHGITADIADFIQDMGKAYEWADIVVCRSGALTIAELSVVGLASILIPFPYAVNDHQTFNAEYLSKQGAALLLAQSALSAETLQSYLLDLIDNPSKRLAVAIACKALGKPAATQQVAELCLEVGCG